MSGPEGTPTTQTGAEGFPTAEATVRPLEEVAHQAGHVAGSAEVAVSPLPAIATGQPHYFRGRVNPFTMDLPASWGSNRRT